MNYIPLSNFSFQLSWLGAHFGFSELSGLNKNLDTAIKPIINIDNYSINNQSIILKRGIYISEINFEQWSQRLEKNQDEITEIQLQVFDLNFEPLNSWQLKNPTLISIEAPSLLGNMKEFAIECMEISHEGLL